MGRYSYYFSAGNNPVSCVLPYSISPPERGFAGDIPMGIPVSKGSNNSN